MPSGGYRPGGGRPRGSKDSKPRKPRKTARKAKKAPKPNDEEREKIRKMMSFDLKAKAAMYQDFLVKISQGKKLTLEEKKVMNKLSAAMEGRATGKAPTATDGKRDPLTYLLDTMNDESLEPDVRFRAAVAAAPFVHPRAGEDKGKKKEKSDRAEVAGRGKFAAGAPPIRVVK